MGGRGEPELTGFVQNVVLIKKVQTQAATVAWKQVKDQAKFFTINYVELILAKLNCLILKRYYRITDLILILKGASKSLSLLFSIIPP